MYFLSKWVEITTILSTFLISSLRPTLAVGRLCEVAVQLGNARHASHRGQRRGLVSAAGPQLLLLDGAVGAGTLGLRLGDTARVNE